MNARDEAIVRLTQAGMSGPAVAAKFGVTVRTVQRARSRAGVCKPPRPPFTAEEIRLAESLLDDGASYGEVARTLGRHIKQVIRRFPGRSIWKHGRGIEIARMFAELEALDA